MAGKRRGSLFIGPDGRECGMCRQVKTYDRFSPRAYAPDGTRLYKSVCKDCCASRARQWCQDNRARHADTVHAAKLRNSYGMIPGDYGRLLAEQNGVCAICGKDEPDSHGRTGTKFRLSVDHCHATGRVRGLLCNRCNRAIGLLGDNVELLERAIRYLKSGSGNN